MTNTDPEKTRIMEEFRRVASEIGHPPSRPEFASRTGISEYRILKHFPSYSEAVRSAGLQPDSTNVRLSDDALLEDWGQLVRRLRHIPTRDQYGREGKYSPSVYGKHFGPWALVPTKFREWAAENADWSDVLALLPTSAPSEIRNNAPPSNANASTRDRAGIEYSKLGGRPTYGNPIDFRGLRHEPVNEQGVVFLFGMVARELGYSVEAVQTGFPDCEAKRQVDRNKWQRVRIEFEFESRNYRDHGHPTDGCDVVVCWRHNWAECPTNIEVVELSSLIQSLAKSED